RGMTLVARMRPLSERSILPPLSPQLLPIWVTTSNSSIECSTRRMRSYTTPCAANVIATLFFRVLQLEPGLRRDLACRGSLTDVLVSRVRRVCWRRSELDVRLQHNGVAVREHTNRCEAIAGQQAFRQGRLDLT